MSSTSHCIQINSSVFLFVLVQTTAFGFLLHFVAPLYQKATVHCDRNDPSTQVFDCYFHGPVLPPPRFKFHSSKVKLTKVLQFSPSSTRERENSKKKGGGRGVILLLHQMTD